MTGKLAGKTAIITGAAQGMGAATARLFAQEGANCLMTDIRPEGAGVADEIGASALFARHDVSDEDDWKTIAALALDRFGGADILINNAGIVFMGGSILEIERADFQRLFDVNTMGCWLGIKHVAPQIIANGGGAIVNIASIAAITGLNGIAPYAVSKWGVRGLSRTAALELGPKGIRVNTIMPGTINTQMGNIANETIEELNARHHRQPVQRVGEPQDIASACLFLASADSGYLAGTELVVDGGMTSGFYTDALPNGVD
ncbi:SDR family NAD(P)-dependent oxidoreductase [Croceicoccus mobilis]|uniref:3-alpha-hydroxysteroid dehydrogenase n=1 Tax=Croceicoccus mobilis TaxID=1703339 RepID=A0A917DYV7_9SPHN|nr:SDR family oxidoreductase [Croceicoccus mobilis]GGD80565.1 3-alpha-hydroxysteroid dehydrogenase [Croceicoccus mobilis]